MNPAMESFANTVVTVARVVGCVTVAFIVFLVCALCRVAGETSRREGRRYPKRPL